MTNLSRYKARYDELKASNRADWQVAHDTDTPEGWDIYRAQEKSRNADYMVLELEVRADPQHSWRVCDAHITFQAPQDYDPEDSFNDNYLMEQRIEERFPRGEYDSESGQGFMYINSDQAQAVLNYITRLGGDGRIMDMSSPLEIPEWLNTPIFNWDEEQCF